MNSILALSALAILSTPADEITAGRASDAVAMMAHWRCSAWAAMANDHPAAEHHFSAGLEDGRRFVEAARSGQISEADWSSEVPLVVAMTVAGPTTDFSLGRIYEAVSTDAYDSIARRDESGSLLVPEEFVTDEAVLALRANNRMRQANCSII